MEFPDKKAKRKRSIKLFLGYGLVAIMIGLATTLLVYMAQGYGYNSADGVVRNGLIFVDSHPTAASVMVDNEPKSETMARLMLNEGRHSLSINKEGYRNWSKNFNLEGGRVLYFSYPLLIPNTITTGVTTAFDTSPIWASQSPDRRWLVMQQNASSPVLTIFDLANPDQEPLLSTLPASQLSGSGSRLGNLSPVEWADDNSHILLKQNLENGANYIIFDRENADNSINLSKRYNLSLTSQLTIKNKKYDKYLYYDPATQMLYDLDLKVGLTTTPLLTGVIVYTSYGDDLILYVTYANAQADLADVYVKKGQDIFKLKSLSRDSQNRYPLAIGEYSHTWYYLTASTDSDKVLVYRNPLNRASAGNTQAIEPQMSLALDNPRYISFSVDFQFIAMQSGKNFVVYDNEQSRVFRYTSSLDIGETQRIDWMDAYRIKVVVANKIYIFEFDGANLQELIASRAEFSAYFDEDYQVVYSLTSQENGKTALTNGQLLVE